MEMNFNYRNTEDVFKEITKVSPLYRNLTYEDIEKGDAIYPYKGEPLRNVTRDIQVHKGNGVVPGKLYVRLERPLFHSGTLSRKAPALMNIYPEAVARVNTDTARTLSIENGNIVRVSTKTGSLELPAIIDKEIDGSSVMLTNNFETKGAFSLMGYSIDPVTGAPCIDNNEVVVEKVKV